MNEAKRDAYKKFREDCDAGLVALAPQQTFNRGYEAGYAARPSDEAVREAIEGAKQFLVDYENAYGAEVAAVSRNVKHVHTLINAASSPWRSVEECVWHEADPDDVPQYYSDCGTSFCFNDDGLTENQFKFCYSCGKPIKEEKWVEPPTFAGLLTENPLDLI